MTRLNDFNRIEELLEILTEEGFEGLAKAITVLINEAMKIERQRFLRALPHEGTERRNACANKFRRSEQKQRFGDLIAI